MKSLSQEYSVGPDASLHSYESQSPNSGSCMFYRTDTYSENFAFLTLRDVTLKLVYIGPVSNETLLRGQHGSL